MLITVVCTIVNAVLVEALWLQSSVAVMTIMEGIVALPWCNSSVKSFDNDHARIVKFTHDWAPTNQQLFKQCHHHVSNCPRCPNLIEDNDHIIRCQSPNSRTIWHKWQETTKMMWAKLQTPDDVQEALMSGIKQWHTLQYKQPETITCPQHLPSTIQSAFQLQTEVGWKNSCGTDYTPNGTEWWQCIMPK